MTRSRCEHLSQLARMCLVVWPALVASALLADEQEKYPDGRIYTTIFGPVEGKTGRQLVAVNPQDGKCETIVRTEPNANVNYPRVSPDGRAIAYATSKANQHGQIWVKRLSADTEPQRVWEGQGSPRGVWAADGKHVLIAAALEREDGKSWTYSYWNVDSETSEAQAMQLPEDDRLVDCAHRSDLLLLNSARARGELFTMRPDRTSIRPLTQKGQIDYQGRFSPDDQHVAVVRKENGVRKISTVAVADGSATLVVMEKGLANFEYVDWAPDGKRLAVVVFDWKLEAGQKIRSIDHDHRFRIAIIDADGANYHELTLDRVVTEISAIDWR